MAEGLKTGDKVTLKRNPIFRGVVGAISPNGKVYVLVTGWGGEEGGYRGRRGVLNSTRYPIEELEVVSDDDDQ